MLSKAIASAANRAVTAFRRPPIANIKYRNIAVSQRFRAFDRQRSLVIPVASALAIKRGITTTQTPTKEHKSIPKDINFFETLEAGLGENAAEPIYDIDVRKLRISFLRKQQQVHPDSYAQKSSEEYQLAQNQSSYLNKAYNTLKEPLARAQYMLALNGVEISESESLEDPELLMEVMEIREQMEEAESEDDIEKLKVENNEKIHQTADQLTHAFKSNNLEEAKELTVQLQYWDNIRRAIVDWAPGKRLELKH
ncbi:molecular chaperone [Umbelopsis nana]